MEFEIERSNAPVHAQGQAASATALETPPEAGNATFRELDLDAGAKPAAPEPTVDPELQKQQNKARRLARALVSDILVYNREKRDSSLKSGNLVQALGPEIKKSWEVYKERVTPELANSTDHFREALNEILAEGQPIF
jgi:gas vesicle protein